MSKDKYFADIYIHLRPDRLFDDRAKVERELCASSGVFSVHFDTDETRAAMIVAYNPEAVSSEDLLDIIRNRYEKAASVASVLMRVSNE